MKKYAFLLLLATQVVACQYEDDTQFFDDDGNEITEETTNQADDDAEEGSLTLYRINGNSISKVKDYPVAASLLTYQQDAGRHQEMWDFVTRLLPDNSRGKLVEFEVFHGGGELLGYVAPVDANDLSRWRFALAIDAAGDLSGIDFEALFTFVTLHEYGHVLTLNNEQIDATVDFTNCNHYHTGEGCAQPNAYINRLVELGWTDIINEHDEDNPDATYDNHRDRFVSRYAATNPGEDIAEVFSFFITGDRPAGNQLSDRKIKLLYEFPELVNLRDQVRAAGDVRALRQGGSSMGNYATINGIQIRCSQKHMAKAKEQAHF